MFLEGPFIHLSSPNTQSINDKVIMEENCEHQDEFSEHIQPIRTIKIY